MNWCLLTLQPGIYVYHGRVSKLYTHDKHKYTLQGKEQNHKVKTKQGEYKIIAKEILKQINYKSMLQLTNLRHLERIPVFVLALFSPPGKCLLRRLFLSSLKPD